MVDGYPLDGSEVPTCMDGLFLVGSRIDLAGAEIELISKQDRERVLRTLLCGRKRQIRLYNYRLLAVAWPYNSQRPHGSRLGDNPGAGRVFRSRRHQQAPQHHTHH